MSGKYYGIIPCSSKTKSLVYFVTKNFSPFSAFSHSKKKDRDQSSSLLFIVAVSFSFVVLAMRGRPWVSGFIFSGGSLSLVASFVPVLVFFRE
jgi:hypothetical protein